MRHISTRLFGGLTDLLYQHIFIRLLVWLLTGALLCGIGARFNEFHLGVSIAAFGICCGMISLGRAVSAWICYGTTVEVFRHGCHLDVALLLTSGLTWLMLSMSVLSPGAPALIIFMALLLVMTLVVFQAR